MGFEPAPFLVADLGGCWHEITFQETRDTGFLLARLEQLWPRVPRYKPLSVGVVLKWTASVFVVSGAPGGDKDEACAKAGLDKVADQLK